MNLEVLVEIDFRDGTEYCAVTGIAAPERYYAGRLLSISGLNREVGATRGEFRSSEFTIELDDADSHFSARKAAVPFLAVPVRVLWGDIDEGFSDFEPLATGRIARWSKQGDRFSIGVQGVGLSLLDALFPFVTDAETFPAIPEGADVRPVPIVYGTVEADGGALPAYLVDPDSNRYVLGLGELHEVAAVFANGEEADSADYSTSAETIQGETYTVADFDSDQGDAAITWNGNGIEDENAENITNPARQWEALLALRGIPADAALFAAAADQLDSRAIHGALAVTDIRETLRTVAEKLARSANLYTFVTPAGQVGCFVPTPGGSTDTAAHVTEQQVLDDGLALQHPGVTHTEIIYRYAPRYTDGAMQASGRFRSGEQEVLQRFPTALQTDFPYIRAAGPAANVAADRLFFAREERVQARMEVDPALVRQLTLGDTITVRHFRGLGADGFAGWPMQVTGLGVAVGNEGMTGSVTAVDVLSALYPFSTEFLRYLPARWPRSWTTRLEWQRTDQHRYPSHACRVP